MRFHCGLKPTDIFFIKVKTRPRTPKNGSFTHAPTCLRHDVEICAYCRPNFHTNKECVVSVTAVVLMQPCQGDTVCFYAKGKALYLAF